MMGAMTEAMAHTSPFPGGIAATCDELAACADGVIQTLRVSRSRAAAGNLVRLDGLEAQVAQLCARCLCLDRRDQPSLRELLLELRAELDALTALQAARREAAPCRCTTY